MRAIDQPPISMKTAFQSYTKGSRKNKEYRMFVFLCASTNPDPRRLSMVATKEER